jgi:hypothetical protein
MQGRFPSHPGLAAPRSLCHISREAAAIALSDDVAGLRLWAITEIGAMMRVAMMS